MDTFISDTLTPQDAEPYVPDPDTEDWRYWAKRITHTWQSSVANIIETGKTLIEAKDRITPGEFGDMIKKYLPFKQRTAQKLMKLARNKVLANAAHVPHLPPHYGTLIALDTLALPDTELEAKIHDGTITPKMERKDVARLKPKMDAAPRESPMMKLKQTNIEQARKILDLESDLAHAKKNDGSLFGRGDPDKLIARILIETLGEDKARKVARVVLGQGGKRVSAPKFALPDSDPGKGNEDYSTEIFVPLGLKRNES